LIDLVLQYDHYKDTWVSAERHERWAGLVDAAEKLKREL
jgi:hypothetical protein